MAPKTKAPKKRSASPARAGNKAKVVKKAAKKPARKVGKKSAAPKAKAKAKAPVKAKAPAKAKAPRPAASSRTTVKKSAAKPAAKPARKPAAHSKGRVKQSRMKKTSTSKKPSSRTNVKAAKAAKPVKKAAPKKAAPKKPAKPVKKAAAAAKAKPSPKKLNGRTATAAPAKVPAPLLKPPIGESVKAISATPVAPLKAKKRPRKCPLSAKQLARLRAILLQERDRLKAEIEQMEELTNASKNGDADVHPGYSTHIAEYATDSQFIETSFVQLAYLQKQLNEVRQALERIEDGTYGICEGSGNPIPLKRLEAKPTARYSIEYRKKFESGLL